MDEIDARFDLLKSEMDAIQAGIRSYDTFNFQIKGWCITLSTAICGFAIGRHTSGFVWLALSTTVCFYLVESYYRAIQRVFMERDGVIEEALKVRTVQETLEGGHLVTPALNSAFAFDPPLNWLRSTLKECRLVLDEARELYTFGLYLLIAILEVVLIVAL